MPVGRVEHLHLGSPVDDFLGAMGYSELAAHLRAFSLSNLEDDAFPNAVHKYLELLRQYCSPCLWAALSTCTWDRWYST